MAAEATEAAGLAAAVRGEAVMEAAAEAAAGWGRSPNPSSSQDQRRNE